MCHRLVAVVDCAYGKPAIDYILSVNNSGLKLALLAITHRDADHCMGLPSLLEAIDLTELQWFWQPYTLRGDRRLSSEVRFALQRVRELIRTYAQTRTRFVSAEDTLIIGNLHFTVIHPADDDALDCELEEYHGASARNDMCLVIRVDCHYDDGLIRLLIGGDAEADGWSRILSRSHDLKADLFRLPHHGSWFYDNQSGISLHDVLAAVQPKYAVVSVGSSNSYGHPDVRTLAELADCHTVERILCTEATKLCRCNDATLQKQCAGHIVLTAGPNGVAVTPSVSQHTKIIDLYNSPMCRIK